MTIAACYVSPEGIVLGADSTTTNYVPHPSQPTGETHHFNFGQKIFEVGRETSIGIVTWGLGSFLTKSYRTLVARLGDGLAETSPGTMREVAKRWAALFWTEYDLAIAASRDRITQLVQKGEAASDAEKMELFQLRQSLACGFCIGGHAEERNPEAFEVWFRPELTSPEEPTEIPIGLPRFWGWSNLLHRLNYGIDDGLFEAILRSGKWSGVRRRLAEDYR